MEKENSKLLIVYENQNYENEKKFNPWKSDIYSCGILALILTNAISLSNLFDLDNLKENENIHHYFEEIINKSVWENETGQNENLSKKMRLIIMHCIKYDPKERINFKILKMLLTKINELSYEEISSIISNHIMKPIETKREMLLYINEKELETKKLNSELEDMKQKYISFQHILEQRDNKGAFYQNDKSNTNSGIKNLNELLIEMENSISIKIGQYLSYEQAHKHSFFEKKEIMIHQLIPKDILLRPLFIQEVRKSLHNQETYAKALKNFQEENINNDKLNEKASKYLEANHNIFNFEETIELIKSCSINEIYIFLERKIKKRIKSYNTKYWNFQNMNLNKEQIFYILGLAEKSDCLCKMVFYGNKDFDEECAKYYFEILKKTKTIIGVDLYLLNFPIKLKKQFLDLSKSNDTLKYFQIEKKAFEENEAKAITENFKLNINDHSQSKEDSKYWSEINLQYDEIIKATSSINKMFVIENNNLE